MATEQLGTSTNNSVPHAPETPAVIRSGMLMPPTHAPRVMPVLLLAWIVSALVHGIIVVLFLFVTVAPTNASIATQTEIIAQVDDEKPKEANLTNEEPGGLDPNEMLNYNINRIDEKLSVPGPANPTENIGVKDAADGIPHSLPPPPGMSTSEGQGGGPEAQVKGLANPVGFAGGIGGNMIPGGFGGRSGATREMMVREGGGNTESEAAVAGGIGWLVRHQAPDGRWSLDGFHNHGRCNCNGLGRNDDIAGTAFGLLPLLAAGETHKNPRAKYGKNVERGLRFLISKQARDGNFGGDMYSHGLAAIAMCEAYGMTADPLLKVSAQRAINFIRAAQSASGGWRYQPREGGDTSVVGWQVMALKSGQMAGLEVDDNRNPTLANATKWLNSCATADGSGYGYTGPEATETMTSVGLLCRLYLGTGPRNSGIIGGVNRLRKTQPGSYNSLYYYYYATQVMHHVGGTAWQEWNAKMRDLLVKTQDKGLTPKHPHLKGSWSPVGDVHGGAGGRIMTTSLATLTLEVYYRHLPLYRRDIGANKAGLVKK